MKRHIWGILLRLVIIANVIKAFYFTYEKDYAQAGLAMMWVIWIEITLTNFTREKNET